MKKWYSLLVLGLLATGTSMAQNQGGPDQYGYTWKNDAAPGGPTYNWIDITSVGTPIPTLGDDNTVGPFNFGFTFRYYWTDVNRLWVGSNGYVVLNGSGQISSIATGFPTMPTASAPNNVVAAALSDLNFDEDAGGATNPGAAYFYTNNVDTAIVSYHDVPFWTNSNANGWQGSNTFQIIFAKADSSITFQYQSQSGSWNASYDAVPNPLVIGIENVTGTVGLTVSNNVLPTAPRAIKFYYPASTTFSVTDAAVKWNQNEDNRGFFAVSGVGMPVQTTISNDGNTTISGSVGTTTTIRKASATGAATGTPVFSETGSVNNLAPGTEQTITYNNGFAPPVPPTSNPNPSYIMQTSLTLAGDLNPGNNLLINEVVVLDTAGVNEVTLRYDDGTPSGVLGFEGGANYFKPPFYPVEVRSLNYFLALDGTGTTPTTGYTAKLFADDGPGGGPGTLLYSQTMQAADVLINSYNNIVELTTPAVITSGGFYVSWETTGGTAQDVRVGVDNTGPFSRQSYEVLFGVFGEYRSANEEDLMISATIGLPAPNAAPGTVSANLSLEQSYPNPASNMAHIGYSLAEPAAVSLQITTVTGQVVKTMELGTREQGRHLATLNTSELASGMYFYTLRAGNDVVTKKMVIAKQ